MKEKKVGLSRVFNINLTESHKNSCKILTSSLKKTKHYNSLINNIL